MKSLNRGLTAALTFSPGMSVTAMAAEETQTVDRVQLLQVETFTTVEAVAFSELVRDVAALAGPGA